MNRLPKIGADTSLAQRAYDVLREAILSNQFRPGQVLSEERLAAELAISRTPVRAALKRLAFEHLIILNPSKNIVVSEISRVEFRDVQEARLVLEPAAARQLADCATAEQIHGLWHIVGRQQMATENGDTEDMLRAEYLFHATVAGYMGNRWIAEMVDTLNLVNRRYLGLSRHLSSHWQQALQEHETVVTAIGRRDRTKAEERMHAHIGRTYDRLLQRHPTIQ